MGWEKKRDVIRHYDELRDTYDSLYGQEQNAKIKFALSVVHMKNTDLVLDVGCGTGLLFDHISHAKLIVGLDLSLGLLNVAAERAKHLSEKTLIFLVRADADCMPFRGEIFDKIFAVTLLQNLPNPNVALREIMRVAKSKSTIVVTGLKKYFTEKEFARILNETDLKLSAIKSKQGVQCYIAICRKG